MVVENKRVAGLASRPQTHAQKLEASRAAEFNHELRADAPAPPELQGPADKWNHPVGAAPRRAPPPPPKQLSPADALTKACAEADIDKAKLVPKSMIELLWGKNNDMGLHHLGWHLMMRPDRDRWITQLNRDPAFVKFNTDTHWLKNLEHLHPKNEGSKGNGVDFGAMHQGMIEVLSNPKTYTDRGLKAPNQKELKEMFRGWKKVPAEVIDSAGKNMTPEQKTVLKKTLTMLADIKKNGNWVQFKSIDELCNFMQTQLGKAFPELMNGTHNLLHMAMAHEGSPIDVGDPMLNLFNKDFWGLHGFINNVIADYMEVRLSSAPNKTAKEAFQKEIDAFNKVKAAQVEHMVHSLPPTKNQPVKAMRGPPVVVPTDTLRSVSKHMFEPPAP